MKTLIQREFPPTAHAGPTPHIHAKDGVHACMQVVKACTMSVFDTGEATIT